VKSIEIPAKCEILDGALSGLNSVSISRSNPFFLSEGDFVLSKDKRQVIHYFGSRSRIVIGKSVEFLGISCFSECTSLIEVIFEEGCNLKRIDEYAFSHSGLKSIRIPKSVEFVGKSCFSSCNSLEVILAGGVQIEADAFGLSPVRNVKIPVGVKLNYRFRQDCTIEFIDPPAPSQ
jgi:hypothetical protein